MNIIKTHNVTLYGGNNENIVLKPLSDKHLPFLTKWCADPEVLYWTEGGIDNVMLSYDKKTVHAIYNSVSQNAFCFLIEVDGVAIGECWLQKMNIEKVSNMYSNDTDVRRIDMCIGEKEYWNKGLGTQFIGMMIDFAFNSELVNVLHCFCEDYNTRSSRIWEKHNFKLILSENLPQPQKGKYQYHYKLTKEEYITNRRYRPDKDKIFLLPINDLQPSQLYISQGKLSNVQKWFDPNDIANIDPIPIKYFDNYKLIIDGHTRIIAAILAGMKKIPVYIDTDELDMVGYSTTIKWCIESGIKTPYDLKNRIVSFKDYEQLWRKRCMEL